MKTCFVIQRFDGGAYDKRYRETFAPAIERGGAKPIRADEVLGTRPVVEKIEQGIKAADVAFAEISEDNANVFLELGFSLALGVPTVIICDRAKRARLPFDVAHRPVNFYLTDAQSDYEKISKEIENGIAAALLEERTVLNRGQDAEADADIDDVKATCLTQLLDQSLRSPIGTSLWQIQKEVASSGISERMVALAVASLLDDGFVDRHELKDNDGEPFNSFALSQRGQKHLLRSYSSIMKQERERARPRGWGGGKAKGGFSDELDEDIPF